MFRNNRPLGVPANTFSCRRSNCRFVSGGIRKRSCNYTPLKKQLRDSKGSRCSLDEFAGMAWYERTFEEFRLWLIDESSEGNFFQENLGLIVTALFLLFWVFIYVCTYGVPDMNEDTLQKCIPQRYRDEPIEPVETLTEAPRKEFRPSASMSRLDAASKGAGRPVASRINRLAQGNQSASAKDAHESVESLLRQMHKAKKQ